MKHRFQWPVIAVLTLMLLAAGFAIPPKPAYACSCAMPESVAEELNRSDAVFDGTVVAAHRPKKWYSLTQSSADPVTWTFEAHEIWKGKVASTIKVTSAQSSASCGYEFKEGARYIVYARSTGDSLDVSLCSRTVLQTAAASDLAELGSGSIPPKPAGDGGTASNVNQLVTVLGLLLAIAVAVYAGIRIKRHQNHKSG